MVALVAVGCGEDSDDSSDRTTTTETTTQVVGLFFTTGSGGPNCTDTSMVERTVEGPDVLAAFLKKDYERWGDVVRKAGIKVQ